MQKEIDYFNQISENYLKAYGKKTAEGYSFRVRREKVLSLIPEAKSEKNALDVGCGPGIMIKGLLDKNYKVVCVDAAPEMINLVKRNYGSNPNVEAEVGYVNSLNFPDNSFDLVIAMGLLEYLEDQEMAMREIKRVTKNQGKAILTFPNKKSPWRIVNRIILLIFKPFIKTLRTILKKDSRSLHHREYELKEVINFLEKNGFKINKSIFYNFKIIPHPFDKIFPCFTIWQSKILEKLDRTFLKFIGTGFIVSAEKKSQ